MNCKRVTLFKVYGLFLLMWAVLMQGKASVYGQPINLSAKSLAVKELILEIEKQTPYKFVYEDQLIRGLVIKEVTFTDEPVDQVLQVALRGLPLKFEVIDHTIVLKKGAIQQELKAITGKVFDDQGHPIEGATVRVKGTLRASSTDRYGNFTLEILPGERRIEVTCLGYHTKEFKVEDDLTQITLQTVSFLLEESVVTVHTGYRALSEAQLTGAVANINQQDFDQRVAVSGNFLENLEGKLAGLVYNPQSDELSIRGVSTFDAVRKPLIVLDGFPTEIDLQSINPNDIVSVNVLKDAAAASIYGSRASNGVIVVETKRGKFGDVKFNLRATAAIQSAPNFDYMQYANSSQLNAILKDNLLVDPAAIRAELTGRQMASTPVHDAVFDFKEGLISREELDRRVADLGSFDNLQQYKDLFYRNARTEQVDFDLSGGSDKHTYLLGGNYLSEKSSFIETNNKRILLNFASTHDLSRFMHLDFKGSYRNGENKRPLRNVGIDDFYAYEKLIDDSGNALPVLWGVSDGGKSRFHSIIPSNNDLNMENGLYDQLYYPYADVYRGNNTLKSSAVRFQARLNTRITPWLDLDVGGAYEDERNHNNRLMQEDYFDLRRLMNYKASQDPITGRAVFDKLPKGGVLSRDNGSIKSYTARAQFNFNYADEASDHQITGLLGSEIRRIEDSGYLTSVFGYDGQTLIYTPIDFVSLANVKAPEFNTLYSGNPPLVQYERYFGENYDDRRFVSFYADGTYFYKEKYAITGSIRTDQSNLFGTDPKYRYKPFYSVGANWNIHKEDFMSHLQWITHLKIRGAYGVNGNTPTTANGKYMILSSGLNYSYFPFERYYDVISPENSAMRWERTATYNLGLDFSLWNYRLSGSLDYYYKNSTDVIGLLSSDPTSGFNSYNANTASIINNGFEMQVTSSNILNDRFSWKSQLTGSFNFNKVKEVMTVQPTGVEGLLPLISQIEYVAEKPIGALYAYDYAGLNDKGQPEIIDKNGNRRMVSTSASGGNSEISIDDMVYMGTTTPKYVLGLNNQFSLGQFDLSFLFMYYGGHVMRTQAPDPYVTDRSFNAEALNYWKESGDEKNTDIPGFMVVGDPNYFNAYAKTGYTYARKFVKNADFIRLRDLVLTYRIKEELSNKFHLSNTMIRFQAQNLFKYTFSDNSIDPDAIDRNSGVRTLPRPTMFSFSLYTNF